MHPEKQTLIILTPGFPSNEAESTCLPAHQVFVKTLKRNYPLLNIIILSFQYPYINATYQWYDNIVISFNGRSKGNFHRIKLWLRVWKKLRQLKKQNDVIGLFSFWCNECAFVGTYFARLYSLKHYCWICGQDAKKQNHFVKFIRPKSAELVAMSDFLAKEFYKSHHIKPLHVIPNGIDVSMFSTNQSERTIHVLGAGSLIPLKQFNIFIEVVEALTTHIQNLKTVIYGTGPEKNNLELLVQKNNAARYIYFAGEKPHSEILQVMQQAKIFLHTSSYEGFSTVCLEALYAGAHVISFCKPMEQRIQNWHVVTTKDEMINKALQLLQNANTDYTPVLAYSMSDTAKAIMQLFNS